MKILITGGTSATALKLLKAFKDHQVILADYGDVPSFSSSAYTLISLGVRNDDTLAHTLLNNCLDQSVDAILPIQNFEIEAVVKSEVLFNEFNIDLLLPKREYLDDYFKLNSEISIDFVVFEHGEVTFSTGENELIIAQGRERNLSGAYYFNSTELSLITI
ncbi:hypothetical protein FA048_15470 [Pedobacter polaris]|uniref:Uncharacterized protein n=1 Tax=Pedobacter polaris TaxID=2571273 RepID=A0A4U1CJ86_9SPHI|nr:hypothetical protein [Pedobacter polaris]TKC06604.1 hypothetical protein FA048_15470 [Pedobacter polaris]